MYNQPVIILRLYGDDVEPAYALGARKTVYKVGCIYFTLEHLDNIELSELENYLLCVAYYTEDVKSFGWESVLKPLVDELTDLERTGILLEIKGGRKNVKVLLDMVTSDNLFLNSIFGFVESFSANFPCRSCATHRKNFEVCFDKKN